MMLQLTVITFAKKTTLLAQSVSLGSPPQMEKMIGMTGLEVASCGGASERTITKSWGHVHCRRRTITGCGR